MSLAKKIERAKAEQTAIMCDIFEEVLQTTKGIGPKKRADIMHELRKKATVMKEKT